MVGPFREPCLIDVRIPASLLNSMIGEYPSVWWVLGFLIAHGNE